MESIQRTGNPIALIVFGISSVRYSILLLCLSHVNLITLEPITSNNVINALSHQQPRNIRSHLDPSANLSRSLNQRTAQFEKNTLNCTIAALIHILRQDWGRPQAQSPLHLLALLLYRILKAKSLYNRPTPTKGYREGRLIVSIIVKHFLSVVTHLSIQLFASATCASEIVT